MIRIDLESGIPVQAMVNIDSKGDFEEVYEPISDTLIQRYLDVRNSTSYISPSKSSRLKWVVNSLNPFRGNLSQPEFLPTNAFRLIEVLSSNFPLHRLLVSDFHYLPDAIQGIDAPVVQTRYKKTMVPCSTYLLQPGKFDIFFPTNFNLLKLVYEKMMNRDSRIISHEHFLKDYAELSKTETICGENPMLNYYENVSFFIS